MLNQFLSLMTETMLGSAVPFGLIDRHNFTLISANKALEKIIQEHQVISGNNLMQDYPELIDTFKTSISSRASQMLKHGASRQQYEVIPVASSDGDILAIQCIASPYTEPVSTDEPSTQTELENQFQTVLENFPLNAWMCSPKGEMFWINKTSNLFSHDQAVIHDPSHTHWISKIHPDDLPRCNQIFAKALIDGVVVPFRYRLRDSMGKFHWHLSFYCPIRDGGGKVLYWAGTGVNIQQFVEVEERLGERIRQLQSKNESDKKLLWEANELLARSQKMELVSNLAGGVAHDLNNLLFIMSLNAEQLFKALQDQPLKDTANNVRANIKKAARLSSQLMGFSGRKPQSLSAVEPTRLIEEIKELLDKAVGAETNFSVHVEDGTSNVLVDKMYLENSLINLAINARDAVSGRGTIRLSVRNQSVHRNNVLRDYVVFEMQDDGMGMTPEVIARIYEPFFTTKQPNKGTGLGLPMVKNFVESSDGFMQVNSAPDVGTTFSLFLPKSHIDADIAPTEDELIQGGKESILIIDDDVGVRDALAHALYALGYKTVNTAFNSDYALQFLGAGVKVDLIISDIKMPGKLTVLDFVKSLESLNLQIPVIFATGYSADIVINEGLVDHKYPVLFKPFSLAELSNKIRDALPDLMKVGSTPSSSTDMT